jgi:PmbA protein
MDIHSLAEQAAKIVSKYAGEYIVKITRTDDLMAKYARGESTVTQSWSTIDVEVYAAKNQRILVTSYSTTTPERALEELPRLIEALQPSPLYAPLPQANGEPLSFVDEKVREVVLSGDARKQVEELALEEAGDVAGKVEFALKKVVLVGSNGADYSYEATHFNGYVRVFQEKSSGQWSWTSSSYEPSLARKALEQAVELASLCSRLPKKSIEPGRYRVLLSPMVAGNLVEHLAMAASAGSIIFGFSFLQARKPGDKVASEELTVLDKPRDTSLPGFTGFDDEGIATKDKPIVEKGVLKTILHNTKTARVLGGETTGNAGWITPHPYNIEVQPGDHTLDELIEALGTGVYITNNWYTRFQNYLEGRFSTVSRDAVILYENKKPVACTERIRIADSMPNLFSSIEAIGRETWQIEWWEVTVPTRIPHILVKDVGLSRPT